MARKTLAVIAARGGSKGIPHKNLLDLCGKPLIAWTVAQARAARGIDVVVVSSDSDQILAAAEAAGAVGVRRPDDISGDLASSESAWLHALDAIDTRLGRFERIVALQATSPIRDSEVIMGKWLAALTLYACMLLLTALNFALLFKYGNPDWKPAAIGYLGLLLQAGGLLAIGTFLAGLNISFQLCVLGFAMVVAIPAMLWLKQTALLAFLIIAAIVGIGAAVWQR